MKNSQVAVLCAVILAAAADRRGEQLLARPLAPATTLGRRRRSPGGRVGGTASGRARSSTVAMMPKSKGNAYFIACRKGAEEAATELGVELIWDGPTDPDPAKQNEIVETWITRGVDVIAVAVENREGISTVAPQGPRAGASRSSPGTPTPSPTPATSSSTRRRPRGSATR